MWSIRATESITPEQLNVEVNDAGLFWQGIPIDLEQEATVTFKQVSKSANGQKPQSNGVWGEGVVHVLYDVPNGRIQVWMYDSQNGWVQHGKDVPVDFAEEDQFSVCNGKDGTVEIYRNGKLIAKLDITP